MSCFVGDQEQWRPIGYSLMSGRTIHDHRYETNNYNAQLRYEVVVLLWLFLSNSFCRPLQIKPSSGIYIPSMKAPLYKHFRDLNRLWDQVTEFRCLTWLTPWPHAHVRRSLGPAQPLCRMYQRFYPSIRQHFPLLVIRFSMEYPGSHWDSYLGYTAFLFAHSGPKPPCSKLMLLAPNRRTIGAYFPTATIRAGCINREARKEWDF